MDNTHNRGMALPQSKLTDDDIRKIRELVALRAKLLKEARDITNKKLAESYGVHYRTIDRIASGETWGHIK